MRMGSSMLIVAATAALFLAGCGKVDNTPPSDAITDTPALEIDEGVEVPADEIGKQPEAGIPAADEGVPDGPGGMASDES